MHQGLGLNGWIIVFPMEILSTVADRNKTESQNPKQNHKTLKQNRKTQNKITKLKTESQNPKQNHKTQNRNTKLKTTT